MWWANAASWKSLLRRFAKHKATGCASTRPNAAQRVNVVELCYSDDLTEQVFEPFWTQHNSYKADRHEGPRETAHSGCHRGLMELTDPCCGYRQELTIPHYIFSAHDAQELPSAPRHVPFDVDEHE